MTEEEFARHVECMRQDGFAILPDILTERECDAAQDALDRLEPSRALGSFECLFNKDRAFERI